MDWDMVMHAGQLKKRQEEMLLSLTEVMDSLMEILQESEYLAAYWKGMAANTFYETVSAAYRQAVLRADEVGETISSLSELERSLAVQEKKVKEELQKGGFMAWME